MKSLARFGALACVLCLAGCSSVNILNPADGSTFTLGQTVSFEGEVTRSSQTGGADRSDELSWSSSLDGHLGDGRTVQASSLSVGSHRITAEWSGKKDRIAIEVSP